MIDLMQQNITGLEAKLQSLRDRLALFQKAQGLEEEEQKARLDLEKLKESIQESKTVMAELQTRKAAAIESTGAQLSATMSALLPDGKAVFKIEDEAVFIAWERNGILTPYAGLSGGERVAFDLAIGYALAGSGDKVLVLEAAEMDNSRLFETLSHIIQQPVMEDAQIIINTCHPVTDPVPAGWEVTTL